MLENISYCPVLFTRVAEIKALSQLPATSKSRIFPLFTARPWPNAKSLDKTWEKLSDAFSGYAFGLDLDILKGGAKNRNDASVEFNKLFDPNIGFRNYYDKVRELRGAVPVLRMNGAHAPELNIQLEHLHNLERGVILRVNYGAAAPTIELLREISESIEDVLVFVDAGWGRDILQHEQWVSEIITTISEINPNIEMVVSGSSFPDSFASVRGRAEIRVEERALFSNIIRRHNAALLTYGDWGSTRPPSDPIPMTNKPRLDLPLSREWICFRQEGDEDYQDIAIRIMDDLQWSDDLSVWGNYMIATTAEGLPGAIKSAAGAAAARINIHMHRQAQFDLPQPVGDGDEPYTDD